MGFLVRWIVSLYNALRRKAMSAPTIEDIIDSASKVQQARNVRKIEVGQALEAVQDELGKQTTVDSDVQNVNVAIENFKNAAVAYKIGDPIDPLKDLAQKMFEQEGVRLVDVAVLNQAIAVRLKEVAEADAANIDEDAAIADLTDKAHNYTKEVDAT